MDDGGGRPGAPWGGRLQLFLRPPGAGLAALSIGARRRQLLRAGPARLPRRGSSESRGAEATGSGLGSPRPCPRTSEDERPAVSAERFAASRGRQLGVIASMQMGRVPPGGPLGAPGSSSPRTSQLFFFFPLRLVITRTCIVIPFKVLFHGH